MEKIRRTARIIKISRSEEEKFDDIKGQERDFTQIKTRMDKKDFELRRDVFNEERHTLDPLEKKNPFGMKNIDYAQYVA
jgi:hypothetical protein